MKNKYGSLRILIGIILAIGILTCLAGIYMMAVNPVGFLIGAGMLLGGILTIGMGQIFQVLIDIEQNTREANELARAQASNLEQYARAFLTRQVHPSSAGALPEASSGFSHLA